MREGAADKRRQDGLDALRQAAASRGGVLLSCHYKGTSRPYLFRCHGGHEWQTVGSRVLRGAWCPTCAHSAAAERRLARDGLQRLSEAAKSRGGLCLSESYAGSSQAYAFRCAEGHEWQAFGSAVLRGTWCSQCAHARRRLGLEAAREAALARGGLCLSERYENYRTKMAWQCDRGHVWETCLAVVRRGAWCPVCAHMAQLSNRNSKARARYGSAGSLGDIHRAPVLSTAQGA
jgi:hypothetical protein